MGINKYEHERYTNLPFEEMENHKLYLKDDDNPHYICKGISGELPLEKGENFIEFYEGYYHIKNLNDLNNLFKMRDECEITTYSLLIKVFMSDCLNKTINRINIISNTDRYISRRKITKKYDVKENILNLFKILSKHKLDSPCKYKFVGSALVIKINTREEK